MTRKLWLFGFCLILALSASCSKCEKGGPANLTALIPGDSPGVVLFPNLATTIGNVGELIKKFSVGPVASFLSQAQIRLNGVLGFDPLKVEEWKKLGLDPTRGIALVAGPGKDMFLVAGISDAKVFEAELQKRLKEILAADQQSSSSVDGVEIHTIGAKAGDQNIPRIAYFIAGNFAVLASGAADQKALAHCAKLKTEESLASAPWFVALNGKVAPGADLVLVLNGDKAKEHLPAGAAQLAKNVKDGMVLSFSLSKDGLGAKVFLGLNPEAAAKLQAISEGVADAHLERLLPDDTVLALKGRANVQKILEMAFGMNPETKVEYDASLARAKDILQLDVEAATVRNLGGNGVLGISLGKIENLTAAIRSGVAPQMASAFAIIGWVQIKDVAVLTALIDKAVEMAPPDRLPLAKSTAGSLNVLSARSPQGVDTRLFTGKDLAGFCLGEGCEQRASKLAEGQGGNLVSKLSPEAKKLFDEPSLALIYINCAAIVQALSGLDASALGDGGMMVKVVLDLAMTAVRNLKELTGVVRFWAEGVSIEGHLQIQ